MTNEGFGYLAAIAPLFNTSVDRLDQVPRRLQQLFEFSAEAALSQPELRAEAEGGAARQVIATLVDELKTSGRLLDKEAFRALANRVKQKTGQKGRPLFHPIRIALTAAADGPELDLLVPAMERGAELPADTGLMKIMGAFERALAFNVLLTQST